MVIGAIVVLRNRDVAMHLGRQPHVNQWGFMTSDVRQNIAVVGTAFFTGGLVFFVLSRRFAGTESHPHNNQIGNLMTHCQCRRVF